MLGAYATRSIFLTAIRKRASQASIELLNFFKKQFCRLPTVICLIKRAADNLINFQAVVKKRPSKFELVKCCNIIRNSDQVSGFKSYKELLKFQEAVVPLTAIERTMVLYYSTDYLCFSFQYKHFNTNTYS